MYKDNKKVFGIGINDSTYATTKSEKVGDVWVQVWRCPYLKGGIVSYVDATLIIIKGNNQAMLSVRYVKSGKLLVTSNLGWNNKIGKVNTWIKICLGTVNYTLQTVVYF